MSSKKKLKVKLIASTISILPNHKLCVKGLGLRRMNHEVTLTDTPCVRGLIKKVDYLLSVEEV